MCCSTNGESSGPYEIRGLIEFVILNIGGSKEGTPPPEVTDSDSDSF